MKEIEELEFLIKKANKQDELPVGEPVVLSVAVDELSSELKSCGLSSRFVCALFSAGEE